MPSRWIADGQLRAFYTSVSGSNAAALQLRMAIGHVGELKLSPVAEAA
jgi:hypothetical protein